MKYSNLAIILISFSASVSCSQQRPPSEQVSEEQWFKGNLHTHSYWSDGDEFPEVIMQWYKSYDYHFVALSDHNILAEGEKWITIREDSIYENAFGKYLEEYGSDWVEFNIDTSRINVKLKTFEEYRGLFEEEGKFLIIQSEEITDRFENKPVHVNATNIREKIDPQGGNNVSEVLQNNIDAVISQREETGVPMIPHVNHPNFGYAVSLEDMIALKGERFFEIFNGHPMVHNQGDSLHMSTEEMWDLINISYIENNQPVIYGLATDDSHHYHRMGKEWSNAGRGWIMVQADTLSAESIIDAMETGRFYATTGVTLKKLEFDDSRLFVEVEPEDGVAYNISFIGCRDGQTESEEFKSTEGTSAGFELTDDILFVRCKVTSSKPHINPIENMLYEIAWTQPVTNVETK